MQIVFQYQHRKRFVLLFLLNIQFKFSIKTKKGIFMFLIKLLA